MNPNTFLGTEDRAARQNTGHPDCWNFRQIMSNCNIQDKTTLKKCLLFI